jgi:hypothetical protein
MQNPQVWVEHVPDGAVSVTVEGSTLVLKASNALQERFEVLDFMRNKLFPVLLAPFLGINLYLA